ncbi:MAG TPA: 1,2-phenylacetyl-CoA epoxidase subunit PaaC [Casimicrobiaceae bacterium]|nr:1,2-phenylacetyl-CoA epoxidase subunit PaaC [Casimicrobiaceae bacterium]
MSPTATADVPTPPLFELLLRLGDSDLILAQRLGEWVGKAPAIEEDIALTNVGLDLLGQARLWLGYAGEVEEEATGYGRTEDELAFLRDVAEFRNVLLVEQPNGNFADTMARQFLYDQWHVLALEGLARSADARVAAIAGKALKEVRYHVERSADWVVRLGDGTDESHRRMQGAVDALWMYTGELFMQDALERGLVEAGIAVDVTELVTAWRARVEAVFAEATLVVPPNPWMQGAQGRGGKQGVHTEHLGHLLAEMQFLQRAYPGAQW